jgi:energy-coupling factor transporter ATP-binding protein EcfA2
MFYYRAFGLKISSEINFPELYQTDLILDADIQIKSGEIPSSITINADFISDTLIISPQVFLLKIEGVATYLVEAGKTITIEMVDGADLTEVRLFCLSNAFAALLHQRGKIPLHAAAFIHENELVLIMGESGVGKSTTLAAMINRGYSPFSDDICIPYYDDQDRSWYTYSSYPMMKFWADTYTKVNIGNIGDGRKLRSGLDKYGVYFHEKFIPASRKIKLIILLEIDSRQNEVRSRQLTGIESFSTIHAQAYRKEYLEFESMLKDYFIQSSEIAKSVKSIMLSRPDNMESPLSIVECIESILIPKTLASSE